MKRIFSRKSLVTLTLGVALTSLSSSAFAATYQVQPNDTLYKIAQKNGISLVKLICANWQIQNLNVIYPGQNIQIPSASPENKVAFPKVTPEQKVTVPTEQKINTPKQEAPSANAYADAVVSLVNQERAKAGLQPLQIDAKLSGMAMDKAKDMNNNQYFSHTSPTYGSPFDMMKQYGIQFSYAGENIAMGQQSPDQVMQDWMNSQGHRENILKSEYTTIGVAYYNGYWVQEFIKS